MPRYDFRCSDCDHAFEVRMSMSEYSEGPRTACPECGSTSVERSFSSVGVLVGGRGGGGGNPTSGGGCGPKGFT